MLFANVSVAEKYDYQNDRFRAAYRWLKETDIRSLPAGSYPILEGCVTANVQDFTTIPPEQGTFESHEKFFDIQYIVSGKERFGVCRRDLLTVKERFEERDLILYEEPKVSGTVILEEGDLVIFAPEDAHKPGGQVDGPMAVRKVVVKVAV